MNDAQPQPAGTRDELRCRWLSHAAAAFDLMFHPDHQADLVTFDRRESRALDLGRDLTTWLIQQHANAAGSSSSTPTRTTKRAPTRPARRPAPDAAGPVAESPSPRNRSPSVRSPPGPG